MRATYDFFRVYILRMRCSLFNYYYKMSTLKHCQCSFVLLVISLFTITILHCLAHLVSYFIMIGFSFAGIGGTAYLWYTYFDIKYNLDDTPRHMLLSESVRNEKAFLWYSIIATIITVSSWTILFCSYLFVFYFTGYNSCSHYFYAQTN